MRGNLLGLEACLKDLHLAGLRDGSDDLGLPEPVLPEAVDVVAVVAVPAESQREALVHAEGTQTNKIANSQEGSVVRCCC